MTGVICRGNRVGGVTSLGNNVFVVRYNCQQVEVYDATTFALRRHLTVPELGSQCYGLAVCSHNRCLYVSDWDKSSIHRVKLPDNNAVTKWSVSGQPAGLTVNDAQNLLVVIQAERQLKEFTTLGRLLRTIQLQPDIGCPRQVIQLATGQLVVSHTGSLHRVCLLDAQGALVRSYGGRKGSHISKMRRPRGLAVDIYGNLLVADQDNNRLSVIGYSLTSADEMFVSFHGGLKMKGPICLWYDKSRGRLYVGEWKGGRVIVIDGLKNFNATHTIRPG